jgi:chromate reductase, NAD(P)H dehydrogenase (quinone)
VQILGISGSLRSGSYNRAALRAAAQLLPAGASLELWTGLAEIPAYSEDLDAAEPGSAVRELRAAIRDAEGLLIATPEYNGSLPGALKNALDWASRPFPDNALRHKPAAVIGASTGIFGAVWAQAEVRKVLKMSGAAVIDAELPIIHAQEAFDVEGRLNPEYEAAVEATLDALIFAIDRRQAVPVP